ncbi:hypothetical protein PSTG_05076 [Puccinia striiformis f. sp. tritici PST-78]|uniref:Uncharacterized protein n=1 Tax=Puccinia striiformis f. sp. tritici PST-78 TaxID=1165861 RepID=A0A0L0VQU7_9BASI|nr:hypothetical protein PSTG_05076 [Puccinia striiformis f. sp. tritici PST-78]
MDNPAASRSSPPNNRPSGRSTLGSNNGPPASSTEPSNSALPPNQTLAPAPAVKKNIQSRAPSNGSVRNQSSGPTTNDPPGLSLPTTSRLLESTGRPNPHTSTAKSRDQPPLPEDLAQDLEMVDLYDLRLGQYQVCKNKRLTEKIKDDLKAIMLEYQKKIHLLALQHKIRTEILFKWIGIWNKVRGPNRFNNYCRYSPEARRVFNSKLVPPGERMQQVEEEWRNLDDEEQLKYNDWDFINLLRQRMGLKPVENPEEVEEEDRPEAVQMEDEEVAQAPRKSDTQILKHCKDWAKKGAVDMNFFSTQYQVEGFFILTSTGFNGRVFISGGSFLGQDYMQLRRTKEDDPWRGFRLWATGMVTNAKLCDVPVEALCKKQKQQAIQVTSSNPLIKPKKRILKGPWDTGLAKTNKPKMTAQLKHLLSEASGRVRCGGWPGEKGHQLFQQWNLELRIDPRAVNLKEEFLLGYAFKNAGAGIVDIILEALHNSWIQVTQISDPNTKLGFTLNSPNHSNDISSHEATNVNYRRDPAANTSSVFPQEVTRSSTPEAVIDPHLASLILFIM